MLLWLSPKVQLYDTMVPSPSVDVLVNATLVYVTTDENEAVGAVFGFVLRWLKSELPTAVPPLLCPTLAIDFVSNSSEQRCPGCTCRNILQH